MCWTSYYFKSLNANILRFFVVVLNPFVVFRNLFVFCPCGCFIFIIVCLPMLVQCLWSFCMFCIFLLVFLHVHAVVLRGCCVSIFSHFISLCCCVTFQWEISTVTSYRCSGPGSLTHHLCLSTSSTVWLFAHLLTEGKCWTQHTCDHVCTIEQLSR